MQKQEEVYYQKNGSIIHTEGKKNVWEAKSSALGKDSEAKCKCILQTSKKNSFCLLKASIHH